MSKYKITVKTSGWEKEEIPDQLFIPRSDSVQKKPDQLEFDPKRFRPVENWRGVPKPKGGLWTSDYDAENRTSPWFEWMIENMPGWIPEGDSGLILRPDPELTRAYHINDPDDFFRLQREFPAYHHQMRDDNGNIIPGAELETINFAELFEPEKRGGAGLHALRVKEDALDELGDELRNWDIPSTVWAPGAPLKEVGRFSPRKELPNRYESSNPFRRKLSTKTASKTMNTLFKKLAEIEKRGLYHYSDYLFSRIAQSDTPEELNEIEQDVKSDLTDPDIKPMQLNRIQQLIDSTKFHMLSVGNDAKTPKGLKSGYITGILYLEPGSSQIYDIDAFEEYKQKHKKSGNSTQLWQKFKQETAPHSTKTTCTHASPSCLKDCIYHTGRGGIDNVQAAREMKTSKLFHPNTRNYAMKLIEVDIRNLISLCQNLNTVFDLNVKPVVRLNGTTDINWAKEAAELHRKFPDVAFYDYTKVPKFMDMYLKGENPYTGEPFAPNYHITFSRSESNRAEALGFLERGGNVAIVFDQIPETLTYHGKTYRVIDGDRHDLRFMDDVEGMKQPGEGLVIGLKYKRPIGKEKREQKVQKQKAISPLFQKLDMAAEGSALHEAPFVIQTNGEKNIVIG